MSCKHQVKHELRERRKLRIRKHLKGTAQKPRMSVFRSTNQIYVQIIDDETGRTLASSSSLAKHLRDSVKELGNKEQSRLVGADIAQKAKAANIQSVIFDLGPYKFHGRVKELAEAAREHGLTI
jgi:large subunit ribosomal protein L18